MRRLLVVDDDPKVLQALEAQFNAHRDHWDMVFVASGEAALAELREHHADVIITDVRMPGMDGADLLQRVQAESPETLRIIHASAADQQASLRAVGFAHQVLTSPCAPATLAETLDRARGVMDIVACDEVRRMVGRLMALPVRPEIHSQIVKCLRDPDVSNEAVAELIERDMAMVAKILQVANSGFFGASRRITRLSEAVGFLGFRMVENLAFSLAVFDTGRKVRGIDLGALQRHALNTGLIARELVADARDADDAFLAGVLHDIGIYLIAANLPESFKEATEAQRSQNLPLHTVETKLWGGSHAAVGAYLLGLWNMPMHIVEAVALHHSLHDERALTELVAVVHTADVFAHEIAIAPCPAEQDPAPVLNLAFLEAAGFLGQLETWREAAREQCEGGMKEAA